MNSTMFEFKPGLELGVYSLQDHRDGSHAVFTLFEGPERNQATLKGLVAIGTRAQSFAITSRFSTLEQLGVWVRTISEQTEAARAIGKLPGASFVIETHGKRVRAIVQPDVYNSANFAITLIDENSKCLLATLGGRQFAEGFTLLEAFVVVVALVVVVGGAALIISIARGNRTSGGVKVKLNEEELELEGNIDSAPVTSATPSGQ